MIQRNWLTEEESVAVFEKYEYTQDKETGAWKRKRIPFSILNQNGQMKLMVNMEYDLLEGVCVACNEHNINRLTQGFLYLAIKLSWQ